VRSREMPLLYLVLLTQDTSARPRKSRPAPPPKMPPAVSGRLGAVFKRWGEHGRILRFDSLDPVTRDIVFAILTARKNAEAAAASDPA
jgi:hypothetical protein